MRQRPPYRKLKTKMNNFFHSPQPLFSGLRNSSPTVTTHDGNLCGIEFASGFGLARSDTGTAGTATAASSPFGCQGQQPSSSFFVGLSPSSPPPLMFPIGQGSSIPSSSSFTFHSEKETEQWRSKEAPQEGTGESIKVEKLEKSELNLPSSKIITVSRILKGIPQNPHFRPLKGYSEVAKQSLINAWDHIFEETIDQIQTMQVSGFWVDAKRLWETMQELQNMGYNVMVLRRRLVELTDVMLMLRRHRNDIRGLRRKAEQHRLEKSRLEFEIVKLRAKVEAEKVTYEHVIANAVKMEDEVPKFDDVFAKLAIKQL